MLTRNESYEKVLPILGVIWLTALACFIWDAATVHCFNNFSARSAS